MMATGQVILYGKDDPATARALRRMIGVVSNLDLEARDRRVVEQLIDQLPALDGVTKPSG